MPEGDTVYRAARMLDRALSGAVLTGSDFRVPQHATADLAGGRVVSTISRGKHLLTRVEMPDGATLTVHSHLKMEGVWRVYTPTARWTRPAHEARVVLRTADTVAVGFALGIVALIRTVEEEAAVGFLGPDLLGPDWDEDEALRRLSEAPQRPIAAALLDQSRLAGIGNVFAAEVCFTSGVHPTSPVSSVPDLLRLVRRAKQMLELNKDRSARSTTGSLRGHERLWVYGRDRLPCRRCGTVIQSGRQGPPGQDRATYFCPSCQPAADTST